jgi:RNA polymerase sigma factor (sigma-70 family)
MPKRKSFTDEQLVSKIKLKDEKAYHSLYKKYNKKIKSYFFRQKLDFDLSSDLTVDVLCKAFTSINKYDDKIGTFNNWIGVIAKNTLLDHKRFVDRKRKIITISLDESIDKIDNNDEADTQLMKKDILENLEKNFKTDDIELFKLKYIHGYRFDELAVKSNKSVSTLKIKFRKMNQIINSDY